jgi:hypothetical protein
MKSQAGSKRQWAIERRTNYQIMPSLGSLPILGVIGNGFFLRNAARPGKMNAIKEVLLDWKVR